MCDKRIGFFLVVSFCFVSVTSAAAQSVVPRLTVPAPRLYNTNAKIDVLIPAATLAGLELAKLIKPHVCHAPCIDRQWIGLDQHFAGHFEQRGLDRAGTVVMAAATGLPFLLNISTSRNDLRPKQYWRDAGVMSETLLMTTAIAEVVKNTTSRPRPFMHGLPETDSRYSRQSSYRSFFSAHTALAFAATMSYAKMRARSHPNSQPALAYGLGIGLATTAGSLRIAAGEHYPTDVITGALVGSAIGLFVTPALHK